MALPARLQRIWRFVNTIRTILFIGAIIRTILKIRRKGVFRTILPVIKPFVDVQLKRTVASIEKDLICETVQPAVLPDIGWDWSATRKELRRLRATSKYERDTINQDQDDSIVEGKGGGIEIGQPIAGGKISGAIYFAYPPIFQEHVMMYAMNQFLWSNPLHADIFPGLRTIEASTISMTGNLFHSPNPDCGNISSGGTESIMLACKVYRDIWYHRLSLYDCDPQQAFTARPNIEKTCKTAKDTAFTSSSIPPPEILAPKSVHPAFDKAAQYLNMRIRHVPLDPFTGKVDIQALQSSINEYTCMIVVSAPSFPHGIIDNVQKAADFALEHQIPLHVDACLGSFVLPFNKDIEPVDFRVQAVTSMTVDTHKYGYSPKGTSIVLYRWHALRRFQYFKTTTWPGGIYGSPSIAGSRSGSVIAGTWAAMVCMGEAGYRKCAQQLLECARVVAEELRKIKHIRVLGDPQMTVVAFTSETPINIYVLSDMLSKDFGWNLNILQHPASLHICITMNSITKARDLPTEVKTCVNRLLDMDVAKRLELEKKGGAAMYGTASALPSGLGESVFEDVTDGFLDALTKTKASS